MIVRHFQLTPELANCYIAALEETRDAVLVDAGEFRSEVLEFVSAANLHIRGIFITHSHHDHNDAVAEYLRAFGLSEAIGGSDRCAGRRTRVVHDGMEVQFGILRGVALAVPGHIPDLLCLHFPDAGIVFTGDSLFAGSVGGTSSFANRNQQIDAIRTRLLTLPDETRVYSGHGPVTTIGLERRFNPFLQMSAK